VGKLLRCRKNTTRFHTTVLIGNIMCGTKQTHTGHSLRPYDVVVRVPFSGVSKLSGDDHLGHATLRRRENDK
jgi:hypothetical protein